MEELSQFILFWAYFSGFIEFGLVNHSHQCFEKADESEEKLDKNSTEGSWGTLLKEKVLFSLFKQTLVVKVEFFVELLLASISIIFATTSTIDQQTGIPSIPRESFVREELSVTTSSFWFSWQGQWRRAIRKMKSGVWYLGRVLSDSWQGTRRWM